MDADEPELNDLEAWGLKDFPSQKYGCRVSKKLSER